MRQEQCEAKHLAGELGNSTLAEFVDKLVCCDNLLFDPAEARLHHDMDMCLEQYHIASSHTAYRVADQLKGDSSVCMYARALRQGCRCIESTLSTVVLAPSNVLPIVLLRLAVCDISLGVRHERF